MRDCSSNSQYDLQSCHCSLFGTKKRAWFEGKVPVETTGGSPRYIVERTKLTLEVPRSRVGGLTMQLTAVLPAIALGFVAPAARPLPPADVSFPRESAARWMPHMAAAGSVGAAEKAVEAAPPPIVPRNFVKVKGEILTPYGVLLGVSVYAVAFLVQIPVLLTFLYSKLFDPKRRRAVDWVIHFWAWASMTMCGYVPEVVGLENLPKSNALFVPNHVRARARRCPPSAAAGNSAFAALGLVPVPRPHAPVLAWRAHLE